MATLAARGSGTPVTSGTTWAALTNAVDGAAGTNPATYATYTNATASAVGYIEISGYDFATTIGASDTLNSVTVSVRHFENNTGRFVSVRYQPYDGATAIGTIATATMATAARNDSITFPVTLAQLRSSTFKVRVTITGAASTQSRVESIDYVDVTADYTPVPPAITQASYRFYADGTETGATALANQDTAPTVDTSAGDVNLQIRTRLQSTTAVAVPATDDWQLQWERNTSGTWADVTAGGPETLSDSYPFANQNTFTRLEGVSNKSAAQSFTGDGKALVKASFYLDKVGVPLGNLTAQLWGHTGTFGTTSVPSTLLATSTNSIAATTLTASYVKYDFTFSPRLLASGTPYCIVLASSGGPSNISNCISIAADNTAPTHPGNIGVLGASWSAFDTADHIFEVYTQTIATTVVPYASANLTDAAATTNRLGAGTGSFVAGKISEDGLVDDLGWTANNYTEVLYSVTLKQADLAPTDTLRFRVLRNGATTNLTYTQVPTVTIGAGGPTDRTGTATGSITLTGAAAGVKTVTATATGTLTVAGTASGSAAAAPVLGVATGALTVAGVAQGVHGVAGLATATLTVTGAAAGQKTVGATATGAIAVAGVAAGTKTVTATATGQLGVAGVASGAVSGATVGTATGAIVVTSSTTGRRGTAGTATGTLSVAGVAQGVKVVRATATGALSVAGTASGVHGVTGTATGQLSVAGAASGVKTVRATATATIAVAGTATGQKVVRATATGQIVVASIALGLVEGNAVGRAIGQLTIGGTATGRRGVTGTPTGAITVVGLATGRRATTGSATGLITIAGIVVAVRATVGTATGTFTVAGVALGHIPIAFDIQGEWNGQAVDAMQWGDQTVVDWYMLTPT